MEWLHGVYMYTLIIEGYIQTFKRRFRRARNEKHGTLPTKVVKAITTINWYFMIRRLA